MVEGKSSEGGLWFRTKVRAAGGAGADGRARAPAVVRVAAGRFVITHLPWQTPRGDKDKHGGARVT